MSTPYDFPLTPAETLAVAWVIETRIGKIPAGEAADYWSTIAARLRDWANAQPPAATEEGEMPSQDRDSGSADGTLEARNEAVPGVQKHPRDLVASPRPTEPGGVRPMDQITRTDTPVGGAS